MVGSKWKKVKKLALGFNLCVYVPTTTSTLQDDDDDDQQYSPPLPPSQLFSDAALLPSPSVSPANFSLNGSPRPLSRFSKSFSRSSKVPRFHSLTHSLTTTTISFFYF